MSLKLDQCRLRNSAIFLPSLDGGCFTATPCFFELCLRCAEISICEPDVRVYVETPSATPNDILYNQQWNMKAINAPGAWQSGQFGDPKQQVRVWLLLTTACGAALPSRQAASSAECSMLLSYGCSAVRDMEGQRVGCGLRQK